MKCGEYQAYEAGRLTPQEIAEHARECADCAGLAALDARLDNELAALREARPAPGLWDRIETALGREKASGTAPARRSPPRDRRSIAAFFGRPPILAAAGAAALLIIALGAVVLLDKAPAPSGILARRALADVELKEREHLAAIAALEKQAGPKIEAMDLQMASLYRDKLAAINAQIERCREALASNPGNAHIRRYLLAALQDKGQTLSDVLGTMN